MPWKVLVFAICFLLFSCSEDPNPRDIRKALEIRYRWFGKVTDIRIVSMVKISKGTYFAQIKYGIRFDRDLEDMERELLKKLKDSKRYPGLGVLSGIVTLNELIQKCGRITIRRGQTCNLSASVELANVRGNWIVKFR